MRELTIIIDPVTDTVLVEDSEHVPSVVIDQLKEGLGRGQEIACAMPLAMQSLPPASRDEVASDVCVRIAGYYHNSLIEGPGRRSTVKLQGCPIQCHGCVTPDSWNSVAGTLVPVTRLAQDLLDPAFDRDGISIAGGEPFQQPQGLYALIQELRTRGCEHILVYSGYTYERLQRMAAQQPAIGAVLGDANILIDGPYVRTLADRGGPWTGSGNQRVIDLVTTRWVGRVVTVQPLTRPVFEAVRSTRHRRARASEKRKYLGRIVTSSNVGG